MSSKNIQKLFDSTTKAATDPIKTASRRAIRKTSEATGNLIGNKIADKIIAFKNIWEWNRNTERKIYTSRKKTTNYWLIEISII